ncbi:MAG TPA: hypothetical protein VFT87_00320 [Candidatus Saccharimonadales bacterium]|nr:hypothetical protein [Candidatus Saccharimonadales bacterium]
MLATAPALLKTVGQFLWASRMWLFAIFSVLAIVGSIILINSYESGHYMVVVLVVAILAIEGWLLYDFKAALAKIKGWWARIVKFFGTLVKLGFALWAGFAFWATLLRNPDLDALLVVGVALGIMALTYWVIEVSSITIPPNSSSAPLELKMVTWRIRITGLGIALGLVSMAYVVNHPSLVDRFSTPTTVAPPRLNALQHQAEVNANRPGTEAYTEIVRVKGDCTSVNITEGLKTGTRASVKLEQRLVQGLNRCFISIRINDGPARVYAGKNTNIINHSTTDDCIWSELEVENPNAVDVTVFRYVYKQGEQNNQPIPEAYLKLQPRLVIPATHEQG